MTIRTLSHGGIMPASHHVLALTIALSASAAHAQVASEINRSVWKQKYGVLDAQLNEQPPYAGWLSQDADADGVRNGAELAAGTNPFTKLPADPHFRAPHVTDETDSLSLEFPTVPGKFYQAETSDELADWIAGSLPSATGDGSRKTLQVPKGGGRFFRVRVSDTTSHGDPISDWAKLQLGFSLSSPLAGQTSYNSASLAASLAAQNEVTVSVVIGTGSQPGEPGAAGDPAVIRVARSGSIVPGAVTIPLIISGTAIAGTDYTPLPASVEFPAGVNSVDLKVAPLHHPARTTPATVVVTAGAPGGSGAAGNYRLGVSSSAGVTLRPSGAATGTGLAVQYFPGSSATYSSPLNFSDQIGTTYAYTKTNTTTGSAIITYYGPPAVPYAVGGSVKLQFTSGNLNNTAYNKTYSITAVAPNTFTVGITAAAVPSSGSGNSIIQEFQAPVSDLSPVVDDTWGYGSPNATNLVGADNYSVVWTGYLAPTTAANYTFRLDADDKAKVSIDLNDGNGFRTVVENGWDTPATGAYKLSAPLALAALPATRYPMKVEFVETTGLAKLKFHWQLGTGSFVLVPSAQVFTTPTGSTAGWGGLFYNNPTFTPPAVAVAQTTTDFTAGGNGDWLTGTPDPRIFHNNFSARWTGQVLPQYSQKYYFVVKANEGAKLWINNQLIIDKWTGGSGVDQTAGIDLLANVRYDIRLEYYETTGSAEAHLSWYSEDQAKQVIPTNRLFPAPLPSIVRDSPPVLAGPAITSPTGTTALMNAGSPFSMNVTSSNGGVITAEGLPSWLTLVGGVLSGTPPAPGIYQFTLTTTNAAGSSSVIMTIEVLAGEGTLTRELWTSGVTGASLSDVPWHAAPASTDTVSAAEDNATTYGANTGERLRGYFIAPATANYYFWIAASNAAELWISNDGEPVNKVLRAKVAGPGGTGPKVWNAQPGQKSNWLSLKAGQKYYVEIRHNTGASGASNHLALAWFADPTGNTPNPIANGGGVVPAYVLSPWDNPPTTTVPGTLYSTNLQGVEGIGNITGTGGAFLRVNGSAAVLQLNHAGLSSGITSRRLHNAAGQVVFDIGEQEKKFPALLTSDGGYSVQLSGSTLTELGNGTVTVRISTIDHPDGELTGTFGQVEGSQVAPAPPAYPSWPDEHASSDGANARFLTQASFGPAPEDLAYVKANGYRAWIENQFGIPSTKNVPYILANPTNNPENLYPSTSLFNSWWKNAVTAPDQLRQRAAFALSEIFVVSNVGPLENNSRALGDYYDTLLDHSFGNFRDILKQVTLSPAMGVYLDMRGNAAGSLPNGTHPNENYAREILQLFSSGLYRTWPDGTLVLSSAGLAVPTYDQSVITGFARVYTGWNWGQVLPGTGRLPTAFPSTANYLDPMVLATSKHEMGSKILLDNVVIPPAAVTDPASTATEAGYPVQFSSPAGQGSPVTATITNSYDLNGVKDLEASFDNIINNPAVAPFICRQLIQRLVTSHPRPEYVHRVVRAFNGEWNADGIATGVKGDMKEVLRAILLDYEARSIAAAAGPTFGKQREPVMRIANLARTFPAAPISGVTYRQIGLKDILFTTPTPHRLDNGDIIFLSNFRDFGSSSAHLPAAGGYTVSNTIKPAYTHVGSTGITTITVPGFQVGDVVPIQFTAGLLGNHAVFKTLRNYTVLDATATNFRINIGDTTIGNVTSGGTAFLPNHFMVNTVNYINGGSGGTYTLSGNTVTLSFSSSSAGLVTGSQVYARFPSGSLAGGTFDGNYTVASHSSASVTITLPSAPPGTTGGNVLIPRLAGGYNIIANGGGSHIDLYCSGAHNLNVGDKVYIDFLMSNTGSNGAAPDAVYTVSEIRSPTIVRFTVGTAYNLGDQSSSGMLAYPLDAPRWNRSGTADLSFATWNISTTGSDLGQTPLNSPTVFNFFYPEYRFPGELARAGMTTPEFQLTDESSIMNLTNAVTTSLLSSANTNGFSSYKNNGSIMFDLSPYVTADQTSAGGIPALVDQLAILMTGRTLDPAARTKVIAYVSNSGTGYFPISSPPTNSQMRDRVRAIVHLIATSAEYAIQK